MRVQDVRHDAELGQVTKEQLRCAYDEQADRAGTARLTPLQIDQHWATLRTTQSRTETPCSQSAPTDIVLLPEEVTQAQAVRLRVTRAVAPPRIKFVGVFERCRSA